MTNADLQAQAERDAVDAHQGWKVDNQYDFVKQREQYDAWMIAFNKRLIELEMGGEL